MAFNQLAPVAKWMKRKKRKEALRAEEERKDRLKLPPKREKTCIRHTDGTVEVRVGDIYRLERAVGRGSFGEIFSGVNVTNTNEAVAVKLERTDAPNQYLLYEARLYRIMNRTGNTPGIPYVRWYGTEGDYNVMVMDLLGPSLESIFQFCERQFTLKTVLLLADQMLSRLEYFHSQNFLHRDVKPDNFLTGQGTSASQIYIIDYGLAKRYRDVKTNRHIQERLGKPLIGTARYVSLNVHNGHEQGRRDDLIALGYSLIYFLRGNLPWQGMKNKSKVTKDEKYAQIKKMKESISFEQLCEGLPGAKTFVEYMQHCTQLRFDETPEYQFLRRLFRDLYVENDFTFDKDFDWQIKARMIDEQLQLQQQQALLQEEAALERRQHANAGNVKIL